MSTNTQRVTLKSPKMSNDDNEQSNYRLMNVFFLYKSPYFLILANLQSNKRQKIETLRFSHLSKREIFHSYKKSRTF